MNDLPRIAAPPGTTAPWQRALDSHAEALTTLRRILSIGTRDANRIILENGFLADVALLTPAVPYAWSAEPIQACLAASASIPPDTPFNSWNLDTPAVWWWFERPLPFKTLEVEDIAHHGVRALCFGWLDWGGGRVLGCSAWCDENDDRHRTGITITPSQTWVWTEGETLQTMLDTARHEYNKLYSPGGRFASRPNIGVDPFIVAADGLSRFVLAGLAWINQRVLTESVGHIERHARKRHEKLTERPLDGVRVVSLRRTAHAIERASEHTDVEWSCRWVVGGHFRNQACGPKHGDRRLTWIHPFVKGPENMPLRESRRKVYAVNR